jgi:outer membrane protein insertion porin family
MKRNLLCLLILSIFCFSTNLFAQTISDVKIVGTNRTDKDLVFQQISSKPGTTFVESVADQDIKNIYNTGLYDQVILRREDSVLIFEVTEKPAINQITLNGNKAVKVDKLKEILGTESWRFLNRKRISAGIEAAKDFYRTKGYYGTTIDYKVATVDDNKVDLAITIDEGKKKVIEEVLFEGNDEISDRKIRKVVKTKSWTWGISWLTGSGVVKEDVLENDVNQITKLYLNNGFVDVKVGKPEIIEEEDGLIVEFKIKEGKVYSVGNVNVGGDLIENSPEKTLEGIKLLPGDTFAVDTLRNDTFLITDKFTDIGYAFANVDPQTNIDRKNRKVNIAYQVSKGNEVYVDRINISGNEKTHDNVIRRTLKMQENTRYSSSRVKRSQELLQRLGYFEEVTITPSPTKHEDEIDLNVGVREAATGTFSFGGGVSSGDGFIVTARLEERNFLGTGRSFTINVDTGTNTQNGIVSLYDPRLNDSYWSGRVDLFSTLRVFDDYDQEQQGMSLSTGYPLWFLGEDAIDDIAFNLTYKLMNVDINDLDDNAAQLVKDSEGTSISSSLAPNLTRNTIDNPIDPKKGSRQVATFEMGGLGGDEDFWDLDTRNSFYHPLWESSFGDFVFANRLRLGYGENLDSDEDFPLFKRYYGGGINGVRGFKIRDITPRDEGGNAYGGNKEVVANFELIFPIAESAGLKGVAFYDTGNVFDDDDSIDMGNLREAVGWGIRWRTPLAPIRIEFGYPLDKQEGDDSFVTNFSFGAPF